MSVLAMIRHEGIVLAGTQITRLSADVQAARTIQQLSDSLIAKRAQAILDDYAIPGFDAEPLTIDEVLDRLATALRSDADEPAADAVGF